MKCSATRTNGTPCQAVALPGRELCWAHDPEHREKASAARRAGGANRSNLARAARHIPRDMKDLTRRLLEAIDQVHRGELEPRSLTAMASGAGAVVRLYEVGELEARLEALEERAAQPKGATSRRGW